MQSLTVQDPDEVAATIEPGSTVGVGGSGALMRRPMEFARSMIRQDVRDIHLYSVIGGLEFDLLLGAGMLKSTNTSYVGLDEYGQSPWFQRAAVESSVSVNEWTEWTITAGLRAAVAGLPFQAWKSAAGTDVARQRGFKTISCPYSGELVLAIPAIKLDVVVIQIPKCDSYGNVERSSPRDFIHDVDTLLARSAERVIVCTEEIGPVDSERVSLIGREVDAIVRAPRGGWPGGLAGHYSVDHAHLRDVYLPATESRDEFASYLKKHVRDRAGRAHHIVGPTDAQGES